MAGHRWSGWKAGKRGSEKGLSDARDGSQWPQGVADSGGECEWRVGRGDLAMSEGERERVSGSVGSPDLRCPSWFVSEGHQSEGRGGNG